jgi:hypothetical protein
MTEVLFEARRGLFERPRVVLDARKSLFKPSKVLFEAPWGTGPN